MTRNVTFAHSRPTGPEAKKEEIGVKEILLTRGQRTLVDDEDFEKVSIHRWYLHPTGYAVRNGSRTNEEHKTIRLHHSILPPVIGLECDHMDGNKLNNQRANLRYATHSQNMQNQRKKQGATSQFKGVDWYPSAGKWRARIKLNQNQRMIGLFEDEQEAAKAYNAEAAKTFGEFARLNQIEAVTSA